MNTSFLKALYIAMFFILMGVLAVGCGGGGGDTDTGVNSVSVSGSVDAPPGSNIIAVNSAIESSSISVDGSFTLELVEGSVQLVITTNSDGNPILMDIAVDARENQQITLDAQSTSEALLYLSPGVAQNTPDDASTVLELIRSLPETTNLATILANKIAENPNILVDLEGDPEIVQAISVALQAFVAKITSEGFQSTSSRENAIGSLSVSRSATVNPLFASGLFVFFNEETKELRVENGAKRYVDFYTVSRPTEQFLFGIDSVSVFGSGIDILLGELSGSTPQVRTSEVITLSDFSTSTPFIIKAYGLGFRDAANVWGSATLEDIDRLYFPVSQTLVFDTVIPTISIILGVDVSQCGAEATFSFLKIVNDNLKTSRVIENFINDGTVDNFIFESIGIVWESLSFSIFTQIARDCFLSGFETLAFRLVELFTLIPARITNGSEVIGAFAAIVGTRAIETFTISSSIPPPPAPTPPSSPSPTPTPSPSPSPSPSPFPSPTPTPTPTPPPTPIVSFPTVTTGTYQISGPSSAQLFGTVNSNGLSTTGWFEWGTTTSYGNTTSAESLGSGTSVVQMLHTISGLFSNTTYHFRAVAQNSAGISLGTDMSFTTPPPPVVPPTVTTDPATSVGSSSATLNGTVNPNGSPLTAWFEWGTTTSYGNTTTIINYGGSGTSPIPFSWSISGLSPNTTYHFRTVAQNSAGISLGNDRTFTTLP
ncbi:MAG: hypothetical protein IH874_01895 [Candidatus Dadabacteria bacterium]|nr:hypothetical protein [Candidatus Dadabacteria bacterium]